MLKSTAGGHVSDRGRYLFLLLIGVGVGFETLSRIRDFDPVLDQILSLAGITTISLTVVALVFREGGNRYSVGFVSCAASAIIVAQILRLGASLESIPKIALFDREQDLYHSVTSILDGLAPGAFVFGFFSLIFQINRSKSLLLEQTNQLEEEILSRTAAETELRRSEFWVRSILESAHEFKLIVLQDRTITYTSPQTSEFLGSGAEKLEGTSVAKLCAEERVDAFLQVLDDVFNHFEHSSLEMELEYVPGERKWFHVTVARLPNEVADGSALCSFADISDLKHARRRQQLLQSSLFRRQKLESLGTMSGGIAHSFNNYLTGILGFTELALREDSSTDIVHEYLLEVQKATWGATKVANSILTYTGQAATRREPCDIVATLKGLERLLSVAVDEAIEISIQERGGPMYVEADLGQIEQAILNLVRNASESCPTGSGQIEIALTHEQIADAEIGDLTVGDYLTPGEYVCIRVEDNGSGIPIERQNQIFDPFFSTRFTGRGLGLAVVMGIVKSNHGGLRLISSEEEGTCVEILLPPTSEPIIFESGPAESSVALQDDHSSDHDF